VRCGLMGDKAGSPLWWEARSGQSTVLLGVCPSWWFSSEGLALSPVCVRARMRGIMTWLCASLCQCTPTALQALHSCRSCSATRALYRIEYSHQCTPSKRSMIMLYQQTLHNMDVPVYGYEGSAVHGRASRPFRRTYTPQPNRARSFHAIHWRPYNAHKCSLYSIRQSASNRRSVCV
jgi:hypothetical protein